MKWSLVAVAFGLVVIGSTYFLRSDTPPVHPILEHPDPDSVVVYKDIDGVQLKLHVFYPPEHQPSDKHPAIVFFFGGGWLKGSIKQFYAQSDYLASRGMVAMCADYRVERRHDTTPQECVKDGKSAVRWIRSHADELGIDPEKLVASGGSAGGHVAAATALIDGFNEDGEDTSVSCRPSALVLFNPVFDNGPDGYGHDRVEAYWREFSPLHNIDEHAPPTIVYLGTKDALIPVATAKQYQQRMEEVDARCELRLYEDQEHGFFNRPNPNYFETLRETDLFLSSLDYLQGPPTLKTEDEEPKPN